MASLLCVTFMRMEGHFTRKLKFAEMKSCPQKEHSSSSLTPKRKYQCAPNHEIQIELRYCGCCSNSFSLCLIVVAEKINKKKKKNRRKRKISFISMLLHRRQLESAYENVSHKILLLRKQNCVAVSISRRRKKSEKTLWCSFVVCMGKKLVEFSAESSRKTIWKALHMLFFWWIILFNIFFNSSFHGGSSPAG